MMNKTTARGAIRDFFANNSALLPSDLTVLNGNRSILESIHYDLPDNARALLGNLKTLAARAATLFASHSFLLGLRF